MKISKKMSVALGVAATMAAVTVVSANASTGSDTSTGSQFHAVSPSRILDTRTTHTPVGGGKFIKVKVAGVGGVPADGVTAAELNVVVINQGNAGYIAAYPDGEARSKSALIGYTKNVTMANSTAVKVGADGYVDIYNSNGNADVMIDVEGYYSDPAIQTTTVATTRTLNDGDTTLTHVGGPIGATDAATKLTEEVTLEPGTYQYTLYADFSRKAGTGSDNPAGNNTYGTAFLWADLNGDGTYDWKSKPSEALGGTLQTGAVPVDPTGSIEQPANGTGVFTLTEETKVLVGGFAYNSNTSSYGTGTDYFHFLGANATFVKLNNVG